MRVLQDQIGTHGDTAALKLKTQCEELEVFLKDAVEAVNQLQMSSRGFTARLKQAVKSGRTTDEMNRIRSRIREARSNFMLLATLDTNFQVQKVLDMISPNLVVSQVPQHINNCPPPSRIFHGRQKILDQMHQYFTENVRKQDIFVLHGLGGAGKTQIALKFIAESASCVEVDLFIFSFTNIFFIDSSSIDTIDTGLKNIAKTKSIGDSSQDALQWLRSKQEEWLLFFDNADDPKINLNTHFPQCDHGNILITSRNPGLCVYASSHSVVSDMEENDAVDLLLRSAVQDTTVQNKTTAGEIVLHYLPLAIIQAGAFISKSGALNSYLALYECNRARLLSERPAQLHDDYAWTVYTTWQISFQQLGPPAAMFLQLCSLLHHQGISEQIFKNAMNYRFGASSPSKDELQIPLEFLAQFLGPDGVWDPLCFMDVTNQVRAYSLIDFDSKKNLFSIHPLVHDWTRSTLSDKDSYQHCMVAIVGMSLTGLSEQDTEQASLWMLPHIDFLIQGSSNIVPDFRHEYAKTHTFGAQPQQAEQLHLAVVVLSQRRKLLGDGHLDTLCVMRNMAVTSLKQGKYKEAEELGIVVLTQQRNLLGDNHPDTLSTMGSLAMTYNKQGRSKEAEELQAVVLEKRRNILGDNHPSTLLAMSNLAATHRSLGKLKEAEELGVTVLKKLMTILGENHPQTLASMGILALTYQNLGKLKAAEELQVVMLDKQCHVWGDNHPQTLLTMGNLALTYYRQGKLNSAEGLGTVVVEKRRNISGDNHPDTLTVMANLGATYTMLGRWQEAEELLVTVVEKGRNTLGDNHPITLRSMEHLAVTYNKLERWQEAEALGISALQKLIDTLGDNHIWTLETIQNLAMTYTKLGKLKEAEELNMILKRNKA
ncbi:hypothetical protein C8R44DRAFT_677721 [Mycena epipterygia]|nr:hypothetical protein C8R44DRAFT_677721 [Mycena epipterygia]